jgi:hypothetical protein
MFGWFKKRDVNRIDEIETSVRNSFSNMKTDMSQISQWIGHFKEKHTHHDKKFVEHKSEIENLKARIGAIESFLGDKVEKVRVQEPELEEVEALPKLVTRESILPPSQTKVCEALAALQRENPNSWSSLQQVSQEVYPNRDYKDVRSAILQLVNVLEAEGYVIKKRVRKSVYIFLRKEKMLLFKDLNQIINSSLKKQKR